MTEARLNPALDGSVVEQAAGNDDLFGAKGSGSFFVQALDPESPNKPAVGLVFDINPLDPVVIAIVVAVVLCLLTGIWRGWGARKSPRPTTPHPASRGIGSKAGQENALSTVVTRRQFKHLKKAREFGGGNASSDSGSGICAPSGSPSTTPAAPSFLTRPSTRRSAAAATPAKQRLGAGKQPPPRALSSRIPAPKASKTQPVSPRSTPVPSPPKAGGGGRASPARAAKRTASSSPLTRSSAYVLPSSSLESPMQTRGQNNRAPSVRIGSPKSTPRKRAAAAAGAASSPRSGGGGTHSKRGKPSVLETARREAQQQATDVANTRASHLRSGGSSSSRKASTVARRRTKS